MVEEISKPIDSELQAKEEESVEKCQITEAKIECEEKAVHCEDGKSVEKKKTRKRTNHDEEEGIRLRRERDRLRQRLARQKEDEEKRKIRLEKDRLRKRNSRQNEDEYERLKRRDKDRERRARKREIEKRQREEENKKGENGENTKDNEKDDNVASNIENNCNKKENQQTLTTETDENINEIDRTHSNELPKKHSPSSENKTES